MEIIIKIILLFSLSIICMLGFMYFIVCLFGPYEQRSKLDHQSKPTLPPLPDESTSLLLRAMKGNDK